MKLPIGIENFQEIRTQGFYYVDKTGFITELLHNWGKVNLFTRPRRFGKTLNMSMLKYFFEIGCDRTLFDGLAIAKETELCEEYMGKFPVISISLKEISGDTFETARAKMCDVIAREALRFQFLLESERLTEVEKQQYMSLIKRGEEGFSMTDATISGSLYTLSGLLAKHYESKVVILIDEYDVPLDKSMHARYYEKMIYLIRGLLGFALKTNDSLYFAVLTGCLRVSKESIFTGLNNLNVLSIMDVEFDEHFGFVDDEVQELLEYYQFSKCYESVNEWYDGYRFGNVEVYCQSEFSTKVSLASNINAKVANIKNILFNIDVKSNQQNILAFNYSNTTELNMDSIIIKNRTNAGKALTYYGTDFSGFYSNWKSGEIGLKALSGKGFYQSTITEQTLIEKGYTKKAV